MSHSEAERQERQAAWDHAWKYFNVHATQRMSVFNFYLILVGLLTAGMVKTLEKDFQFPWFGCVLGITLIITSFIFWRFDVRTSFLVQRGEDALKVIEGALRKNEDDAKLQIFSREETMTPKNRHWYWPITYSDCLRVIFAMFAILGLLGVGTATSIQLGRDTMQAPNPSPRSSPTVGAELRAEHTPSHTPATP